MMKIKKIVIAGLVGLIAISQQSPAMYFEEEPTALRSSKLFEQSFETIDGVERLMRHLQSCKTRDREDYFDVLDQFIDYERMIIDLWFFLEKAHNLDQETLDKEVQALKAPTKIYLAREALNVLFLAKSTAEAKAVIQEINVFRETESQKFNFMCAFLKISKEKCFSQWWPAIEEYLHSPQSPHSPGLSDQGNP